MENKMASEINSHDTALELQTSERVSVVSPNLPECGAPSVAELQPAESMMVKEKANGARENMEAKHPYSIFTKGEKRLTIGMAAVAALISPLSSTIYLPSLNTLADHYNVSNSLINLTVTSYLIFQGVGPTIFGDFADQAGRRPAYLTAFTVYLITNIALALQNSYAALLVLRMLQSTGASASVVICMGVIADLTTTSERGFYLGLVTSGVMLGPAISPVIGGILAQFLGWRSIFWFLVIVVGIFLIPFAFFIPETCRKIVGNGSIPARGWNISLNSIWKQRKQRKDTSDALVETQGDQAHVQKTNIRFPNPLLSLRLIFEKDVSIVLFYNSFVYMSFVAMTTSIPSIFNTIYGFNDLVIGLCYLPFAIGGMLSGIGTGKLLDRNYRRIALANNFPISRKRGDDLRNYPIEKARIQIMLPILTLTLATQISYGWALDKNVPLVGALVLQFILGLGYVGILQISTTLLVDLYPTSPSTVSASNNLIRCSMGAVATAILNPLLLNLGRGWTFTAFAAFAGVMSPGLWVLVRWGPGWREGRRMRAEKKRVEMESRDAER